MAGEYIDIDLKRAGIRTEHTGAASGFVEAGLQKPRVRVLEDGQQLSGPVARAFVRRYGVETATIGLSGLGTDPEEVAARIENDDVFTVTAYHGVFLEMAGSGDFPSVVIELAGLRSCIDYDGSEARWCAEEVPQANT